MSIRPGRQQRLTAGVYQRPIACYPKVYNIEMDPHEDLNLRRYLDGRSDSEEIKKYLETLKKYPNPPAANITHFSGRSD